MDGHQCVRCNTFWASQAGPPERFSLITKWCPNCLPIVFPELLSDTTRDDRRLRVEMNRVRQPVRRSMIREVVVDDELDVG